MGLFLSLFFFSDTHTHTMYMCIIYLSIHLGQEKAPLAIKGATDLIGGVLGGTGDRSILTL